MEDIQRQVRRLATVDDGCIFVMGDNRNNSMDSRSSKIGQIRVDHVVGGYVLTILK